MKILQAKNLTKYFGQGENKFKALNDIDLTVNSGEFIIIMGPSGSGKSTLLFALSGMDEISSGDIYFLDKNLTDLSDDELADIRRKEMGFIFQDATMVSNLDILDNILLPSREDVKDKEAMEDKARKLMDSLGIGQLVDRDITEVSGGQLQRASIARAILHEPKILFGDEPTGALNSKTSDDIMKIFKDLNEEGMTILIVTHDPNVASYASRVLFIVDGMIESDLNFDKSVDQDDKDRDIRSEMRKLGI